MKNNFFKMVLVAGMVSVAAFANAQSATEGAGDKTIASDVDGQVDWVTVGATMPYSTNVTQSSIDTWKAALPADFLTDEVTVETKWSINNAEVVTGEVPAIQVNWTELGKHVVSVTNALKIGDVEGCEATPSSKTVYVLPAPTANITSSNVLLTACVGDAVSSSVVVEATGVGEKQLAYTITRKAIDAAATTETGDELVGEAQAVAGFAETVSIEEAQAKYTTATSQTITVDNLAAGYVYTITFSGVSDQISRKSDVAGVWGAKNTVTIAVIPAAEATAIKHVTNL